MFEVRPPTLIKAPVAYGPSAGWWETWNAAAVTEDLAGTTDSLRQPMAAVYDPIVKTLNDDLIERGEAEVGIALKMGVPVRTSNLFTNPYGRSFNNPVVKEPQPFDEALQRIEAKIAERP